MQISKEEAQVILALLDRVQVTGKEAMTVAMLQQKLQQGSSEPQPSEVKEETKKK